MADPLSIAASIAGIVSLADIVFTRLTKYGRSAKNAKKEIQDLAKEVNLVGGALNSLSRLARALEDESFDHGLRMHNIEDCNDTLREMDRKLNKSNKVTIGTKVLWPFSSDRVNVWLEDLRRHKDNINLALTANSMDAMLRLLAHEKCHSDGIFAEVKETRQITARIEANETRDRVRNLSLKYNPQGNYEMSLRLRHPRTGLWLLRLPSFQDWLLNTGSKMWLKGIPGAGKTVIAASIIEAALAKSDEHVATAFFFCDYKNNLTHSLSTILSALIYQLAIQKKEAFRKLERYHLDLTPSNGLPRLPSEVDLESLLLEMIKMYDYVFIVVDGLDECLGLADRVTYSLVSIAKQATNVSMALLSRNEDEIRFHLDDCFTSIEVAAHRHDITEYVTAEIEERIRLGRLRIGATELKADIIQGLVDGAKGMFRWVACQLDHIGQCDTDQECRDALKTLPPTLDATYLRILARVPRSKMRMVRLALHFIAYAEPRLSTRQLRQVLSVPKSDNRLQPSDVIHEDTITKYCSSFVRKSVDPNYLEFSHFSVQEFLEANGAVGDKLQTFRISEIESINLLAVECVKFIQLQNFVSLDLRTPTWHESYEEKWSGGSWEEEYAFYSYATKWWPIHSKTVEENTHFIEALRSLFKPQKSHEFVSWCIALVTQLGIEIEAAASIVTSPAFTPLHMAAALSLPQICTFLLQSGTDINLDGPAGTPLRCAVHGLLCLSTRPTAEWEMVDYMFDYHGESATVDTVTTLLSEGAVPQYGVVLSGQNLLQLAFSVTSMTGNFSVTTSLVQHGLDLSLDDIEEAQRMFQALRTDNDTEVKERFRNGLKLFIESIDSYSSGTDLHVRLASLAWEAAILEGLDFASTSSTPDYKLTFAIDDLQTQAFAAIKMGNSHALRRLIADPRLDASATRDNNGNTLMHLAVINMSGDGDRHLRIFLALLSVGCDILQLNSYGQSMLHVQCTGLLALYSSQKASRSVGAVVRLSTEHGLKASSLDSKGSTALHRHIESPHFIEAILDHQPLECTKGAMEHVDQQGFTPLSLCLRKKALASATLLLERLPTTPNAMRSPTPIIQLAISLNSKDILDRLLPVTPFHVDDGNDSPLHYVSLGTSSETVRYLKSLYPVACSTRFHDTTPLDLFLKRCIDPKVHGLFDPGVVRELGIPFKNDRYSHTTWENFVRSSFESQSSRHSIPLISKDLRIANVIYTLVRVGYMKLFEEHSKKSGIIPILAHSPRPLSLAGLRRIIGGALYTIIEETEYWSELRNNHHLQELLYQAVQSLNFKLAQILLQNGVSLYFSETRPSILRRFCETASRFRYESETTTMLSLLLSHTDKTLLNAPDPRNQGLAAIHFVRAPKEEWMVQQLVESGADPNLTVNAAEKVPAIVHHLFMGRPTYAQALLELGANPNSASRNGWNSVLASASGGFLPVLYDLLNHKSDQGIEWHRTCTTHQTYNGIRYAFTEVNATHLAAARGQDDVIEFLLEHGLVEELDKRTGEGWTPLHFAAFKGKLSVIRLLCTKGCSLDATTADGSSALHLAAKGESLDAARMLVEAGCKPSVDNSGFTPAIYTLRSGNHELTRWFEAVESKLAAQHGSDDTMTFRTRAGAKFLATLCEKAISSEDTNLLEDLRSRGFDFEMSMSSCEGCSSLTWAIQTERVHAIQWLIRAGATVTRPMPCCQTVSSAMHLVLCKPALSMIVRDCLDNFVRNGGSLSESSRSLIITTMTANNIGGLEILLDYLEKAWERHESLSISSTSHKRPLAAALNDADSNGNTPLHYAVRQTDLHAIKLLLAYGSDVNAPNLTNLLTPLHLAVMDSTDEVALYLIKRGAKLESLDRLGRTPLLQAAVSGRLAVFKALVTENANMMAETYEKSSALNLICGGSTILGERALICAESVHRGLSLHSVDSKGLSAFHYAIDKSSFIPFLLNTDCRIEDSTPFPWNVMQSQLSPVWLAAAYPLFRKRYGKESLRKFAGLSAGPWSPLCMAASKGDTLVLSNLLDLGADPDFEGCPLGSALMAACAAGRKMAVALLVRHGASLSYPGRNEFRSSYSISTINPEVMKWLLVGRFIDQMRLPQPKQDFASDLDRGCFPWSGPAKAEIVISGVLERQTHESSQSYWSRLMRHKVWLRGKIPPMDLGRRTTRPLHLNPEEIVRIHKDGYERIDKGASA